MITFLTGPDLGVDRIPQCWVVEWRKCGYRVVFSYARQGDAITAHFAAAKDSLREVKTAIGEFIQWVFDSYEWCKMVISVVGIESVGRLLQKCGCIHFADVGEYKAYMRMRG